MKSIIVGALLALGSLPAAVFPPASLPSYSPGDDDAVVATHRPARGGSTSGKIQATGERRERHTNPLGGGKPEVLEEFWVGRREWEAGHRGVDLAGSVGGQVRASGAGVVHFAGMVAGRPVISIDHGGYRTTYEPVTATVEAGQRVVAGTVIGHLLEGHRPSGPAALHWGAKRGGGGYFNPLSLLGPVAVRLYDAR